MNDFSKRIQLIEKNHDHHMEDGCNYVRYFRRI